MDKTVDFCMSCKNRCYCICLAKPKLSLKAASTFSFQNDYIGMANRKGNYDLNKIFNRLFLEFKQG